MRYIVRNIDCTRFGRVQSFRKLFASLNICKFKLTLSLNKSKPLIRFGMIMASFSFTWFC
ncbi:hypothetical protein SAMN06269173_105203 [Hymenobacter mucosus]|uniref:Uncharacterized protein n=1 Tax=Hymenobacter mucosus TaxID=1411120 RepID=A0A238YHN9_9BACT|nr:hypothetical protein SAMN06269173_105203 [Hymenobacter mucosus]